MSKFESTTGITSSVLNTGIVAADGTKGVYFLAGKMGNSSGTDSTSVLLENTSSPTGGVGLIDTVRDGSRGMFVSVKSRSNVGLAVFSTCEGVDSSFTRSLVSRLGPECYPNNGSMRVQVFDTLTESYENLNSAGDQVSFLAVGVGGNSFLRHTTELSASRLNAHVFAANNVENIGIVCGIFDKSGLYGPAGTFYSVCGVDAASSSAPSSTGYEFPFLQSFASTDTTAYFCGYGVSSLKGHYDTLDDELTRYVVHSNFSELTTPGIAVDVMNVQTSGWGVHRLASSLALQDRAAFFVMAIGVLPAAKFADGTSSLRDLGVLVTSGDGGSDGEDVFLSVCRAEFPTSSTITLRNIANFASAAKIGTGIYSFTFSVDYDSVDDLSVIVSSDFDKVGDLDTFYTVIVHTVTVSGFRVAIRNHAGVLTSPGVGSDLEHLSILVLGKIS